MHKIIISVILVFPFSAMAGVYKCPGPKGSLVFQQLPCTNGEDTGITTHGNDVMDRQQACVESWLRTNSSRNATKDYRKIRDLRGKFQQRYAMRHSVSCKSLFYKCF